MARKTTKPTKISGLMAFFRRMRPVETELPPAMRGEWSGAGCKVLAIHISEATPGGAY